PNKPGDTSGADRSWKITRLLKGVAKSMRVVQAKSGKDAFDHLKAGYRVTEAIEIQIPTEAPKKVKGGSAEIDLPDIQVNNQHGRDVVDQAIKALLKRNDPPFMFMRNREFVRVANDECDRAAIEVISSNALVGILCKSANWLTYAGTNDDGEE